MILLNSSRAFRLAGLLAAAFVVPVFAGSHNLGAEETGRSPDLEAAWEAKYENSTTPEWAREKTDKWPGIKEILFEDREVLEGKDVIALETPYRAFDAAIVPISITAAAAQSKDRYIKAITVVADENPSPIAATFNLGPQNGIASISTRIRIDRYTNVRAIAEMNDGKLYMVSNFVKATGGCSAPALDSMEAAMAKLGKMKLKILSPSSESNPGTAQILISHPNYSGLQFDQIRRTEIPAHFVDSIKIEKDGEMLLSIKSDISISEDPSIHFHYVGANEGEMKATVTDSEGSVFEKSWPLSKSISAAPAPGEG